MDPTVILMERATREWTFLLASLPGVALWGALGLALLLASAVVLTMLLPHEYPATGAHSSNSGEAMCPAPVTVPPVGTGIAIPATVPADVAPLVMAGFSAGEMAALLSLRRRVRPAARRRGVALRPTKTSELAYNPRRSGRHSFFGGHHGSFEHARDSSP